MPVAIIREVSPGIAGCELTHLSREPIDLDSARAQHRSYEVALTELGCDVVRLTAERDLPDSVFVEDTAVVLDEIAVVTRPGVLSRRAEIPSIADALSPYRAIRSIEPPGTLDGGDVLRIGRDLFVGVSGRTNSEGLEQLRALAGPLGYAVTGVPVRGCLHLKSAVTAVTDDAVLVNRSWIDPAAFCALDVVDVDPGEPYGANALPIGDTLVYPVAFPATRDRLERRGIRIRAVDLSELAKAEGAVTCCSLIVEMT